MTLQELGNEYSKKADEIIEKVHSLRLQAEKLSPEYRRKLNRRIRSLYEDALNCKQTAKQLCSYYENRVTDR